VGAAYVALGLGNHSLSGSEMSIASDITRDSVEANGGSWGNAIVSIDQDDCPTSAGNIDNAASVEVASPRPAPALFSGTVPNIEDALDTIGARATACLGGIQELHAESIEGIPLALVRPTQSILNDNDYGCGSSSCPRQRDCFENSATGGLVLGVECVIMWSEDDDEGFSGPRSLFREPDDDDECENGSGSEGTVENGIEDGIEFTCTVVQSGQSCGSGVSYCINDYQNDMYDDAIEAFEDRLDGGNSCSGDDDRDDHFRDTFMFADGADLTSDSHVPSGMGGSSNANSEIFAHQDCNNPRVVLVPVVMDNGSNDTRQRVLGFATVFITGCFENDRGFSSSEDLDSSRGECRVDEDDEEMEVRGVPIRLLLTDEDAIGNLCPIRIPTSLANTPCGATSGSPSITLNATLTIQTTR
jgi:hypothetical protein